MNYVTNVSLAERPGKVYGPLRQAWVNLAGKLISFHPIACAQLLRAPEPIFWERIISLSNIGYRVQ